MEGLFKFLIEVGKLKDTQRTGWIVEGVKDPESVSDHLFRTAMAVLVLGKSRKDLDLNKCLKMALIHDIAESQIGDVLVDWKVKNHGEKMKRIGQKGIHGITQQEKEMKEREGMEKMASFLGENGKEIFDLWNEYEQRKTKESIFVKSVELFEMFLQAWEYEQSQKVDISSWFEGKENWDKIKDPEVRKLILEIVEKRKRKSC